MIKEIHIDFNKKTIQFEANHYRKKDMTYPCFCSQVYSVYGDPPTMDQVLSYVEGLWKQYNKALKDHYEMFVKNGKY